jgi:hypothetical protein
MKLNWFKRVGWFYYPASAPGFGIVLGVLVFCALVFRAVDGKSHSVSDTLYGIFPFFASAFLLVDWVASRTSPDSP